MFRRSGSVVPFLVEGEIPDPSQDGFLKALHEQRFRTIETAASEETSVGWCTHADPTGGTFERDAIDFDGYIWLRMRMDKKVMPPPWLRIHRVAAERAAGRRLQQKELRDLKDDVMRKLLPRVLPSIRLIDVSWFPSRNIMLLHGTAKAVQEQFLHLVYRTFSTSLRRADPLHLAENLKLDAEHKRYLEQVSPVNWRDLVARDRANGGASPAATSDTEARTS